VGIPLSEGDFNCKEYLIHKEEPSKDLGKGEDVFVIHTSLKEIYILCYVQGSKGKVNCSG